MQCWAYRRDLLDKNPLDLPGICTDSGYPHDGRADKDSYPHNRSADKDSYMHDRHNLYIMYVYTYG